MGVTTLPRPIVVPQLRLVRTQSDERLAELVHGGDEEAFTALYERYREPLSRYCRSIVRNGEDARDAQQNTMLAALGALRRRPLDGRVKPWLYRIAHNESIDVLRRRRTHEPLDAEVPSSGPSADGVASWEALLADLRALPERQRGALLLRELAGLGYDEIGAVFGISPVAARKSVFEARTGLTESAAGRDSTCEEIRVRISDCDGRVLRARRVRAHLDSCASCAAFAAGMRERRRVLGTVPVLPLHAGLAGAGLGLAGVGAGGAGAGAGIAGGIAGGGIVLKGVAVCAVCAIAGGVVISGSPHRSSPHARSHHAAAVSIPRHPAATRPRHLVAERSTPRSALAPQLRIRRHRAAPTAAPSTRRAAATPRPKRLHAGGSRSGIHRDAPSTAPGSRGVAPASPATPSPSAPVLATSTPSSGGSSSGASNVPSTRSASASLIETVLSRASAYASSQMSQAEGQLQALLAGGGLTAAERTEAQTLLGPGASAPASSSSSALTQLLQNILGNHG